MLKKNTTRKTVTKTVIPTAPAKVLSDKEIVQEKFKFAKPDKRKNCFCILDKKDGVPIHSGLAKTESDAWKKAAHAVI